MIPSLLLGVAKSALGVLTSRVGAFAGWGLCAVLGVSVAVSHLQARHWEKLAKAQIGQVATLAQELQRAAGNERVLTDAVNRQNGAVLAMKRDSEAREERLRVAAQDAAQGRAAAERKAGAILAARPSGDHCKAAVDLIKGRG